MSKLVCCLATAFLLLSTQAMAQSSPGGPESFNSYVLRTVQMLAETRAALGYGAAAFTRDLQFGDNGTLKASGPPKTMCVAAQLEVLVESLNLYAKET